MNSLNWISFEFEIRTSPWLNIWKCDLIYCIQKTGWWFRHPRISRWDMEKIRKQVFQPSSRPLDNQRGNFSKHGVNKCATVRSWKSWHCNRSTALPQRILLKWLMPKAILKWGNQQEAIHRFNCHLFPWPISSNTRRLEYQLLFKVASHSNNSIFATATLLILQLFFYGRIRLIMPICNSCKSLSPFALKEWMIMTLKMELLLCSA